MNRRVAAAGGMVALTALAMVSACTDQTPASKGGGSGGKSGGVFTSIDEAHAINVNAPINPYNTDSNSFSGYNGEQLAWQKNSLTNPNAFYPGLAQRWQVSADGSKVTVHLQPNAKWSDGSKVTATDVKTSAAIAFTQGGGAFSTTPGAAGGLGAVKIIDPSTVEFDEAPGAPSNSFESSVLALAIVPNSAFGSQLPGNIWQLITQATSSNKAASNAAATKITELGKKIVSFGPKKDISAGPFVLQRVVPSEAVLVKNKDFFDASKIAPSQVVLKNYSGNNQIWSYLIARQLDVAPYTATPTDVVKQILSKQGNKKVVGVSQVSASLAFNQSVKPFDNVHVRRGLAYLIDRKLVTKIGEPQSGTASTTTTGLIAAAAKQRISSATTSKLNPYDVDKTKATAELTQAGLKQSAGKWMYNGKPFTVDIQAPNGFSDWISGAGSIASQLTAAGISSTVRTSADYATYLTDIAAGKFAVGFWLIALGPTNYNAYQRLYGSANGWNVFGDQVKHSPAGQNGNWMGSPETVTVPGLGTVNPGALTASLDHTPLRAQPAIVDKLAVLANSQLPVIQLWDYQNVQFVNDTRFTNFPSNNSDTLTLSPGVWMQLGYVTPK